MLILDAVGLTTCVDHQLVEHRTGSEIIAAPLVRASSSTVSRESGRTFERMLYSQTFSSWGMTFLGGGGSSNSGLYGPSLVLLCI